MANELQQKLIGFLTEVLENKNFEKLSVEFPEFDATGGYASEMIFAKVTGEKNGNKEILNIIIKKSKDSSIIQESLDLRQAYISEINVYSKIIPYLEKFAKERNSECFANIPYCYGTISKGNQYIVFLENLKLCGFKLHSFETSFDFNHAKLVLQAYAKFHALCFALKDQEPNIFEEFVVRSDASFDVGAKVFQLLIVTVQKELENVIQIYEEKNRPVVVEKLKILYEKYGGALRDCLMRKNEDYIVLRHGDCWNNNYLFHYKEEETNPDKVMIIDWQFGIFGSPLADICIFLFFCCSRKELDHIDDLLEIYYDTLSSKLRNLGSEPEKCFPKENFRKSFDKYALIGIAGMPISVKLCCQVEVDKTFDIAQATYDGNFNSLFSGDLHEEKYFDRINGILELCIERGLI